MLFCIVRRITFLTALACTCSGCGPMTMPMPVRLEPDDQVKVDAAWSSALTPPDHVGRQQLLDALLTSQAYQVGVDRLSFRSEKSCDAGLVVMEIQYDRRVPAADLFTFALYDKASALLRQERFGREEVATAYRELFIDSSQLEQRAKQGGLNPDEQLRLSALQARAEAATSLFPQFDESKPDQ